MSTVPGFERWQDHGWQGWVAIGATFDVQACLAAAGSGAGRRSRHARTLRVVQTGAAVWVKSYPPPGGTRALHAWRMGRVLAAAGFVVPTALLAAVCDGGGVLVTRDVGGEDVAAAVARRRGELVAKRALLRRLGAEVARLHGAGFVHGDLVPPNVYLAGERFVLLDHDRTRQSRVWAAVRARRNLVQLGRFVVPGLTLADRARVLGAYAGARGLSRGRRHRLAWWVVGKTTARRCAIDGISPAAARRAGYRTLMRSGGPFDPVLAGGTVVPGDASA